MLRAQGGEPMSPGLKDEDPRLLDIKRSPDPVVVV